MLTNDGLITQMQRMAFLIRTLQAVIVGGLTPTALFHGIATAHPYPGQHPHVLRTTSAAFLRNCKGETPASVPSINTGCPNREQGLVASGSWVELLQTVQRDRSGQRGLWYQIRVVQNQANQTASNNAQAGTTGWIRANKF